LKQSPGHLATERPLIKLTNEKQFMKKIKKFIPPIIFDFFKMLRNLNNKYYGLNQLDKKIESYVNFDNGFFVELGANDGITQSNTFYFENKRGWKGVLVEPVGHKYLECVKNRSQKTKIFCNACVSFDYKEEFVELVYSNLMTIPTKLESDINNPLEHAALGLKNQNDFKANFKFGSKSETLNNILIKANAPLKIDFLSLDVEGAEIEVLKGINHKQFRFKYLCIETRDHKKLSIYLLQNNYSLFKKLSIHDYLFKDNT
jgi:FkbM family methyltransferase